MEDHFLDLLLASRLGDLLADAPRGLDVAGGRELAAKRLGAGGGARQRAALLGLHELRVDVIQTSVDA